MTVDRHRNDDRAPLRASKRTDHGRDHWKLAYGEPAWLWMDRQASSAATQAATAILLYVGTEFGLFVSRSIAGAALAAAEGRFADGGGPRSSWCRPRGTARPGRRHARPRVSTSWTSHTVAGSQREDAFPAASAYLFDVKPADGVLVARTYHRTGEGLQELRGGRTRRLRGDLLRWQGEGDGDGDRDDHRCGRQDGGRTDRLEGGGLYRKCNGPCGSAGRQDGFVPAGRVLAAKLKVGEQTLTKKFRVEK